MTRKFKIEELISLPSLYFPRLSWGKDKFAFYWDRTGRIELYIKDLDQGEPIQLSQGEVPRSLRAGFVWARDDRSIIFPKDTDGDEQHDLYRISVPDGQVSNLFTGQGQNYPVEVDPKGEFLSFLSNRDGQMNLYILDLESGETQRLTDFNNPVFGGFWDDVGDFLYFSTNETKDLRNSDIYRIKRDEGPGEKIYSSGTGNSDSCVMLSSCGNYLALNSNSSGYTQPGIMDLKTGNVKMLGSGDRDEYVSSFSPDSRKILTSLNRDARTFLMEYSLETGVGSKLPLPEGLVYLADYISPGRIIYMHQDTRHRSSIMAMDLGGEESAFLLEAEYGKFSPREFSEGEYISYESRDGLTIHGILYRPAGEGPHPAVVLVHGGPTSQDFLSFDPFTQFLVNRGFAVLKPNYRGSTGYGKEFQEMNIGDIGGGDGEDVAAGASFLAAQPEIDGEKIICAGGSYGGFMTFWQLFRYPHLWAGGVAWVGVTDWEAMYHESMEHFKYYLQHLFGSLEEKAELYRERSPARYAENLRGSLLIIHGVNDPRVPISQARLLRNRLQDHGFEEDKDFEYHELTEEGHGSTDIQQKIRIFNLMIPFLEQFLSEEKK